MAYFYLSVLLACECILIMVCECHLWLGACLLIMFLRFLLDTWVGVRGFLLIIVKYIFTVLLYSFGLFRMAKFTYHLIDYDE